MNSRLNIPSSKEWIYGFIAGLHFLGMSKKGFDYLGNTPRAGLASLWTLAITLPIWHIYATYTATEAYTPYEINDFNYRVVSMVSQIFATIAAWLTIWFFLKNEGKKDRFWGYFTARIWYDFTTAILIPIPLMFLTNSYLLSHHEIQSVSTAIYVYFLACAWFIAWRATGVNPFLAAGIAIIGPMIGTLTQHYINLQFFGVINPFEAEWFVEAYNAAGGR